MVASVYWEWEFLLHTIKIGIEMAVVYDGIRLFRIMFSHKDMMVWVEDFIFWCYFTVTIFQLQLKQNNGIFRVFSILGILCGMFLYYKIMGKRIYSFAKKMIERIKRRLTKLGNLFKIKLCKREKGHKRDRSRYGRKKNTGTKKETEQSGNSVSIDDCGSYDSSCSSEQSSVKDKTGNLSGKRTIFKRANRDRRSKKIGNRRI